MGTDRLVCEVTAFFFEYFLPLIFASSNQGAGHQGILGIVSFSYMSVVWQQIVGPLGVTAGQS